MNCPRCDSSRIGKAGTTHYTKKQNSPRHVCKDCAYTFLEPSAYKNFRYDQKILLFAADLYIRGHSCRKISFKIRQKFGINIHFNTVLRYMKMLCIQKPTPQSSNVTSNTDMIHRIAGQDMLLLERRLAFALNERALLLATHREHMQKVDDKIRRLRKMIHDQKAALKRLTAVSPRPESFIASKRRQMSKKVRKGVLAYHAGRRSS